MELFSCVQHVQSSLLQKLMCERGCGIQQLWWLLPLLLLQFYVRNGDQVFRDEVLWDVGNPVYDAQTYAVRVCTALGLEADWFDAIRTHVQQQLDDVRQVGAGLTAAGHATGSWWVGSIGTSGRNRDHCIHLLSPQVPIPGCGPGIMAVA